MPDQQHEGGSTRATAHLPGLEIEILTAALRPMMLNSFPSTCRQYRHSKHLASISRQ